MSSIPSNEKIKISEQKIKPKNDRKGINNTEKIKNKNQIEQSPIIINENQEIIIKTENNEEDEKKENNTKLKLLAALNNINDEINVIIDSKDRNINPNLNLDCFINRPSKKNKTVINRNLNNEDALKKFINNDKIIKSNKTNKDNQQNINFNNEININDNGGIINTCEKNDNQNNNQNNNNNQEIFNFVSTENKNDTEPNNDEKNNKTLNDLVSLSVKNDDLKEPPLQKIENNEMNNKELNKENNNNNIIQSNSKNPVNRYENIYNNFNENYSPNIKSGKKNLIEKLTLYNLDNEDKILLKNMERNSSFVITDISSLNKKDITNYNISLSGFDIRKILNYYIFLVKQNKKEQISLMNLKNYVSDLKNNLSTNKNNEYNNKLDKNNNKEDEIKKNNDLNKPKNLNKKDYIQNKDILSRYQKDLKFFEEQINNMNEILKNI